MTTGSFICWSRTCACCRQQGKQHPWHRYGRVRCITWSSSWSLWWRWWWRWWWWWWWWESVTTSFPAVSTIGNSTGRACPQHCLPSCLSSSWCSWWCSCSCSWWCSWPCSWWCSCSCSWWCSLWWVKCDRRTLCTNQCPLLLWKAPSPEMIKLTATALRQMMRRVTAMIKI